MILCPQSEVSFPISYFHQKKKIFRSSTQNRNTNKTTNDIRCELAKKWVVYWRSKLILYRVGFSLLRYAAVYFFKSRRTFRITRKLSGKWMCARWGEINERVREKKDEKRTWTLMRWIYSWSLFLYLIDACWWKIYFRILKGFIEGNA